MTTHAHGATKAHPPPAHGAPHPPAEKPHAAHAEKPHAAHAEKPHAAHAEKPHAHAEKPHAPASGFDGLGLSPRTLDAVIAAGFTEPTPIQVRCIPPALEGKDVIGCAATGTGKTAAFVLPIVQRLAGGRGTRALILAPTRELADQIEAELERFGLPQGVRSAVVIGGVGMQPQIQAFKSNIEVIVATPGRLNDHLEQRTASLDHIEVLVLDEADRMLDMGFKPQLKRILAKIPRKRQTMLFSATMAGEVADFAQEYLVDPVRVEVIRSGTTAARADQRVFLVPQEEKTALLLTLLAEDQLSTLIFTRTKRRADRVAQSLERAGHAVSRIHADRSQGQRRHALEGFKQGTYRVLVATDIASRGIDVAEIGHVINFDLPHVPEDYVHRVGRTARAEASGRASAFCADDERDLLQAIERLTRTPVPRAQVPRDSPLFIEEAGRAAERRASAPARSHHQQGRGGGGGRSRSGESGGGQRQGGHTRGSSAGGGKSAPSGGATPSGGSWRPKRRR